MKSIATKLSGLILITSLILTGCGIGSNATKSEQDPGLFYTQAAETMSVALTLNAVAAIQELPTNTPIPTDTPIPTLEPTVAILPTDTPTMTIEIPTAGPTETPPPSSPMLHVTENSNCRAGPSPTYGVEGYITTDMNLPVVGINEGRSWWWVENPTYPGYHCWVWKYTSVVEGDISMVPIYRDPWTMTPGDPEMSVSINAYPTNYSGKCPQLVTIVATIHTNRGGQYHYVWLKKGHQRSTGWVTIAADGSAVVSTTFNATTDLTSYFNLKIDYPIKYITKKANYTINCKK